MIAIDTNILVYAHREDSEWHENALRRMKSLLTRRAASRRTWLTGVIFQEHYPRDP